MAQLISFVFLLILQRWFYTPNDFGILGLYVSLSTLLAACSTLKFEYGIVLPKENQKAISLVYLSVVSVLLFTLISIPLLFLLKESYFKTEDRHFSIFLFAVPFTVLFAGLYEILLYWNNRQANFTLMSKSRVVQTSAMEISRMAGGLMRIDYKALIIGRVIGQFVSLIYLSIPFLREQGSQLRKPERGKLKEVIREYRDFPLFTMPTIFISNFANLLLIALFFQFYGGSNAGLISIAIQYISLPFGIIASSFSQVFFQRISRCERKEELLSLYIRFAGRLAVVSVLITGVVYLIPDRLILAVLGDKWQGLTEFMRLSVLWQAIAFISSSLSFIYTRLMRQKIMMAFALLQLALVYVTLQYGNIHFSEAYTTFGLYVAGQCFYYVLTIVAAIYFIKRSPTSTLTT
ncbi:MAG TPA: oligosaccharide flippase family protein [Cyclobacteriaceae bacterium]